MKKEKVMFRRVVLSFLLAVGVVAIFYMENTENHVLDEKTYEVVESDHVKLKVKNVNQDEAGNLQIQLLTKNDMISYKYHNWTLWDGEGNYKKVSIAVVTGDSMIIGKTYPYKMNLSDEDIAEGYTNEDGYQCYIRHMKLDKDSKIAVIYEDRRGQKYVIY